MEKHGNLISTLYHIQKTGNCIKDLNMKGKSVKLKEENVEYSLELRKNLFDMAKQHKPQGRVKI